jgi:membrane fusion protein (multidrug efflux system)
MNETHEPKAGTAARSRKPLLILAGVVAGAGALYGAYYLGWGRFSAGTDDAYVSGNVVTVAPQVAGTVVAVSADDTQLVQRGQVLAELDDTDARIALQEAEASLGQAVRQVGQMYATERQLEAAVHERQIRLDQARDDYQRAQGLVAIQGVSTEDFQHAQAAFDAAGSGLVQAKQQLAAADAAVAHTTLETHPAVLMAEARLRDRYLALQRTRVLAPVTGYVAKRSVQLGQQVAPGTALLAVIPLEQVWLDANFKETELADVRIGQPVRAESDLYGRRVVYTGHVVGLGSGTGSAFALLPAQNATGNWIKVVQRLPVRIALDAPELAKHPLRIGLSMDVSVDTRDRSGAVLASVPAAGAEDSTGVYAARAEGAEALIHDIIRRNSPGPASAELAVAVR